MRSQHVLSHELHLEVSHTAIARESQVHVMIGEASRSQSDANSPSPAGAYRSAAPCMQLCNRTLFSRTEASSLHQGLRERRRVWPQHVHRQERCKARSHACLAGCQHAGPMYAPSRGHHDTAATGLQPCETVYTEHGCAELRRCEQLGLKLYNFHPGWAKGFETREGSMRQVGPPTAVAVNRSLHQG